MKKLIALLSILVPMIATAAPVDGYKDLKFGMTLDEVKKTSLCESDWQYLSNLNTWACPKFKFSDASITGGVMFIDNKLARIALSIPMSYSGSTYLGLVDKYGKPREGENKILNNGKVRGDMYFADDTIIYRITAYSEKGESKLTVHLIYTIKDFDEKNNILGAGSVSEKDL